MTVEPTMLLHHSQELHNNLRARSDHDLTLASLLGVVDGFERIVQNGCFDHDSGIEILKAQVAAGGIYGVILLAFKSHTSMRVPFSAPYPSGAPRGSSTRSKQALQCRRHC